MDLSMHKFSEYFVSYRQKYIHYAYTYIQDMDVSKDIVADSFISFWVIHESLPDDTNIPAYVLRSVRNRCVDYLKKQYRYISLNSQMSELDEWDFSVRLSSLQRMESLDIFQDEIAEIVHSVLNSMPDNTKNIYMLSRQENLSRREIADSLGISIKGVEYHITRILKALRLALKDFL